MRVAKWGNSLAVRLPSEVTNALELKEGSDITIRIAGPRDFEISRNQLRLKALSKLRRLRQPLPEGFVFDRDDAHAR